MSLLSHEKKIIVSLIRDAENEIINQTIAEDYEIMKGYRPITPPVGTIPQCMCVKCGSGPLAPRGSTGNDLCASCRR